MKYVLSLLGIVVICCAVFLNKKEEQPLRIHIVANSSSSFDEQIKYDVKDAVTEYLKRILADVKDKTAAKKAVVENMSGVQNVVASVLKNAKVKYGAQVELVREKIPMRAYGNTTYSEGNYDSLKIQLGQAQGDNWWCVIFPNVCFLN